VRSRIVRVTRLLDLLEICGYLYVCPRRSRAGGKPAHVGREHTAIPGSLSLWRPFLGFAVSPRYLQVSSTPTARGRKGKSDITAPPFVVGSPLNLWFLCGTNPPILPFPTLLRREQKVEDESRLQFTLTCDLITPSLPIFTVTRTDIVSRCDVLITFHLLILVIISTVSFLTRSLSAVFGASFSNGQLLAGIPTNCVITRFRYALLALLRRLWDYWLALGGPPRWDRNSQGGGFTENVAVIHSQSLELSRILPTYLPTYR
jgi:hypothetical protein